METLEKKKKARSAPVRTRSVRKPKTLEAFLRWEQPEGPYKYEWIDGNLEKTEYMMKNTERAIINHLSRAFVRSAAFAEGGNLFPETMVQINEERARIPDVSYFSEDQIKVSARGAQPIPTFAVEIISPNEKGFRIEQKTLDYFAAGVQVLWQVYPNVRLVKVLTSPRDVQMCFGGDLCSAAPALPDLQLTVDALLGEVVPEGK